MENLTVKENLIVAIDDFNTKFWKNLFGYKITKEQVKYSLKLLY